jgi:uncharacterized protein YndB with AHSA1/START domain
MTKNLSTTNTYAAPAEAVYDMLTDPVFLESVCEAQRVLSDTIVVSDVEGRGRVVVVEQEQSMAKAPAFVKKFVGDSVTIVKEEAWATPSGAAITVTIPGKPVAITGTGTLATTGGQTRHEVSMEVKVSVPIVGGKAEDMIAGIFTRALSIEQTVGDQWLAEH